MHVLATQLRPTGLYRRMSNTKNIAQLWMQQRSCEASSSLNSFAMAFEDERILGQVSEKSFAESDEKEDSQESMFSTSAVRVDIEDFVGLSGSQSMMNATTHSLRKCKTHILVPYSRLLKLIGWKALGKETMNCGWRLCNGSYTCLVLLLVIYSYVYDIMACQWKLDLKYDVVTLLTSTQRPSTMGILPNLTNAYLINESDVEIFPPLAPPRSYEQLTNRTRTCGHIVTTYIIPDLLHVAAYLLGLWHFRIKENEHLYALMEKVFLQTANLQTRCISQANLITKLRSFFVMGAAWVLSTISLQGLFIYSFGMERDNILSAMTSNSSSIYLIMLWGLFAVDLFGVALSNCINLAVVLNYSIQCEMLRYYIKAIGTRLKERSASLKTAMRDVLNIRESISLLNSSIARMTSLAIIRFGELCIIGLCLVVLNKDNQSKIWVYRSLFSLVWASILSFPLIQAASLNAACGKFKTVSLNIRVYGYQNSTDNDLDSFLIFISNTTLRAKLIHIPVKPSYLLGAIIVISFTLLLIFQTSLYVGPAGRLF
ncbi:uncharacterized protein [Watersipora subatra]|uniref:uncharacterized protein n=1 Tax=Watersipora subatra TaxID=2589382 RepID=UPI00355C4607